MDKKENFRKEIQYTPINSANRNVRRRPSQGEIERIQRQEKRKREQQRESKKRKIKGITTIGAIALASGAMIVGIPRAQEAQRHKVAQFEKQIRQELANERAERAMSAQEISQISEIEQEINDIEPTTEEIKKNIIEQYLAEYNREHNTNIENCELISSVQNYVFVTADNQYVTHGDHPQEVMDFLTNNGIDYRATGEDTKVYYSYADGVTLEMMTKGENKELVDVTSGQNIQKLNDKSYNNTLIEMADVLEIGSEWAKDPENEELKEAYIQALEEHKEKKEEKEVETASKTENTNNIKTASMDEEER